MSASRRRPAVPPVGGLDALIPTGPQVQPAAAGADAPTLEAEQLAPAHQTPERRGRAGTRSEQPPARQRASRNAPEDDPIQPRHRQGDMGEDREVTLFVYCSREDAATVRELTERWRCSKSEAMRVLIRRAGRDLLGKG